MKINKAELQNALEKVKPGLAGKELIEQSTCFSFIDDRVVTYNDEISISHPIEGLDIKGAVKAQALYAFLNKVKKEEIDIEHEKNQIIIKAGRSKAGLIFEKEILLPLDEEIGKVNIWHDMPEGMKDALKLCYPSCSKDMSNPVLTCIHVYKNIVEASDSYQIIQCKLKGKGVVEDFLIPATAIRELIRYDITQLADGDGWVHFKTEDDTIFSARTIEGKYPSTTSHLKMEGTEFAFPKNITRILEKANVFSRSDFSTSDISLVTIEIKNKIVKISAKNEYGWFEEKGKVDYEGPSIKFVTGVEFLIDIFGKLKTCILGEGKIGFTGENWKHIIVTLTDEK